MIDIIIPVYNESENIEATLDEIKTKINTPNVIKIIYDYDEDKTIPVINEYIVKYGITNISLVKNNTGKGILNAIITGFSNIDNDIVILIMGDSSDDLSAVDIMYKKINEGYDIVCGSRYIKGGKQINANPIKSFLSRTAGLSLHLLTGIPTHDISNSFKMYRKDVIEDIVIESRGGFEIGLEILVKAYKNKKRITEVPSIWKERIKGKSKFNLIKWLPSYIKWYLYAIFG